MEIDIPGPSAPRWDPYDDLGMCDKIDRLEDAISAILEKLGMPKLETFSSAKPAYVRPGQKRPEEPKTALVEFEPKSLPAYQYQQLDEKNLEIRVLDLDPGDGEGVLMGTLRAVSMKEKDLNLTQMPDPLDSNYAAKIAEWQSAWDNRKPPVYNALSYTWGPPVMDESIVLYAEGVEPARLPITKSVMKALKTLRNGHWPKTWWIDQICINQSDVEERNQQVSLMRQIYKKAAQVIVWLDYEGEYGNRATEVMKNILRPPIIREPGSDKAREYPKVSDEEVLKNWEAIEAFFKPAWWDRCWIQQEVGLNAGTMLCFGSGLIALGGLKNVFPALNWVRDIGYSPHGYDPHSTIVTSPFYSKATTLMQLQSGSGGGKKFLELSGLLRQVRSCQTTDTRDKVYAVLGMADQEIYKIPVDYRLPVRNVMMEAARSVLTSEEYLSTFALCQNPQRRHGLPSWAPNLLDDWVRNPLPETGGSFLRGSHTPEFDGDTLVLQGILWGRVEKLCDSTIPDNSTPAQLDAVYNDWQNSIDHIITSDPRRHSQGYQHVIHYSLATGDQFHNQGWLTFLSIGEIRNRRSRDDEPLDQKSIDNKSAYRGMDVEFIRSYLVQSNFTFAPQQHAQRQRLMAQNCKGRKLGFLADNVYGLFPDDAEIGDEIAYIKGAPFPLVLRKQESGDYILIDEAHVPHAGRRYKNGKPLNLDSPCETIRII